MVKSSLLLLFCVGVSLGDVLQCSPTEENALEGLVNPPEVLVTEKRIRRSSESTVTSVTDIQCKLKEIEVLMESIKGILPTLDAPTEETSTCEHALIEDSDWTLLKRILEEEMNKLSVVFAEILFNALMSTQDRVETEVDPVVLEEPVLEEPAVEEPDAEEPEFEEPVDPVVEEPVEVKAFPIEAPDCLEPPVALVDPDFTDVAGLRVMVEGNRLEGSADDDSDSDDEDSGEDDDSYDDDDEDDSEDDDSDDDDDDDEDEDDEDNIKTGASLTDNQTKLDVVLENSGVPTNADVVPVLPNSTLGNNGDQVSSRLGPKAQLGNSVAPVKSVVGTQSTQLKNVGNINGVAGANTAQGNVATKTSNGVLGPKQPQINNVIKTIGAVGTKSTHVNHVANVNGVVGAKTAQGSVATQTNTGVVGLKQPQVNNVTRTNGVSGTKSTQVNSVANVNGVAGAKTAQGSVATQTNTGVVGLKQPQVNTGNVTKTNGVVGLKQQQINNVAQINGAVVPKTAQGNNVAQINSNVGVVPKQQLGSSVGRVIGVAKPATDQVSRGQVNTGQQVFHVTKT